MKKQNKIEQTNRERKQQQKMIKKKMKRKTSHKVVFDANDEL